MFLLNLLDDMLFAAIPAVGFALVFNVPPKALSMCYFRCTRTCHTNFITTLWCSNCFCHFFRHLCDWFLLGVHLSHRYLAHPKVFTVAAIIPMIPGVHAYKAMIAIVQIHHYGFFRYII